MAQSSGFVVGLDVPALQLGSGEGSLYFVTGSGGCVVPLVVVSGGCVVPLVVVSSAERACLLGTEATLARISGL